MAAQTWKRRGGRPKVEGHLRRVPCHGIRLPAWWLFWLGEQKESCGRLVEQALERRFGPFIDKKEFFKKFYGRSE
jgi:hypothetical protein